MNRGYWSTIFLCILMVNNLAAMENGEELGIVTYLKLRENRVDLSAIERARKFVASRDSHSTRPSHCPLNQTNVADFLDKLQQIHRVLEGSSCKEYKDGFLSSFGTSVSKISQSATSFMPVVDGASYDPQVHYKNMNDMMASLSSIISDSRCAFDIKERGLIPVLADVLGSASVSALFAPNQIAAMAGAAGVAVTATLKIISGLLTPQFNMNKDEDRENFIKLACSFFDIRALLEKNHFLHIPTERDALDLAMLKAHSMSIQSKITALTRAEERMRREMSALEQTFVENKLGVAKLRFYRDIPGVFKMIEDLANATASKTSTHHHSYLLRVKLLGEIEHVLEELSMIDLDDEKYLILTDMKENVAELYRLKFFLKSNDARNATDADLMLRFTNSFSTIASVVQDEVAMAKEAWHATIHNGSITNREVEDDVASRFASYIKTLAETQSIIDADLADLGKVVAKQNFSEEDDGTHVDHLIIKEIKAIEKVFFGYNGWRFYEYVRDNSERALISFYQNYNAFSAKFLEGEIVKIDDEHTRRVACATAANIILSVNNSRSLINMGADFIFTSRDFFHDNVNGHKLRMGPIHFGVAPEAQLLHQAESLIHAKEFLAQHKKVPFPDSLLNRVFHVDNIGELMMAQVYADKRMAQIYQFAGINRCGH